MKRPTSASARPKSYRSAQAQLRQRAAGQGIPRRQPGRFALRDAAIVPPDVPRAELHDTKMRDKIKVELTDLLKYYDEHVRNTNSTGRHSSPGEKSSSSRSRRRRQRPRRTIHRAFPPRRGNPRRRPSRGHRAPRKTAQGEDFATLARKESDGPAGSRNQGGLMETSPGGYGIAAVNQALESLPIGKVSDLIEAPDGFHIVKVEKRRPAGPAIR